MGMIKIAKKEMAAILWDEEGAKGNILEDKITGNSRWNILHSIIFSYGDKFYSAKYSVGATEMQDNGPWEYIDEVECTEVKQVEKLVKVWEPV